MITYKEALNKAKEIKPNIDNGMECENYYVFGSHEDDNLIGPAPVCIRKSDGQMDRLPIVSDKFGEVTREFEIEDNPTPAERNIDDYKDRMTSPIGIIRIDPKTGKPIE